MRRITALALAVLTCAAASAEVSGWRGDGSGRYPDAKPPLEWGRVARTVLALRAQAAKPKPGAKGTAAPDGVVREWLALGPLPLPESFKSENDFKKEIVAGEAALDPAEGDRLQGLAWKKVAVETAAIEFRKIFGGRAAGGGGGANGRPGVAYACSRIYSPSGGPAVLSMMQFGQDARAWLNGKPVKRGVNRSRITLARGWNRLLVRSVASSDKNNPSWFAKPVIFGAPGGEYETKNIFWSTPMPANGVGSPVVVNDHILVTADMCNLVCVEGRTGKILWVRSSTYHDAATDAERKAHGDVFREADPLAARLKEIDGSFSGAAPADAAALKEKSGLEKKIHKLMKKADDTRYVLPRGGESGYAPMTPVTDGKNVWALFGTSTLACFDLDGNRRWTRLENNTPGEHGFTSSPVLVAGKVIISLDDKMHAFDAATGRRLWTTVTKPEKGSTTYYKYHGTVAPFTAGGTDCVFTPHGMVVRVADGRKLHFEFFKHGGQKCATPVIENGTVYKMGPKGLLMIGLGAPAGDALKPTSVKEVTIDVRKFPHFYRGSHMSSPLLHDGLAYCVNIEGPLTVVDVRTAEIVYQKYLDADVYWRHGGGILRGGFGSSPTLGGGRIYIFGNQGTAVVIEPGSRFRQLARNRIEETAFPNHWREHQEITITCPVFDGGRIYVRAETRLYCIGEKR